ncbi:MAG: HEAT repeat domain-containing protein [Bacteroidota bacterium]
MTYDEARLLMMEYLEGKLDNDKAARLDAFINEHEDFKKEFGNMKNLWMNMSQLEIPEASPKMKTSFYAMLAGYQQGLEAKKDSLWEQALLLLQKWWTKSYVPQAVLGVTLLLLGIQIGYNLQKSGDQEKMLGLTKEVQQMKQMMLLTLIEQQSATQRLKAVNLAYEIDNYDAKVVATLFHTLYNDENTNVRLAAVEALFNLAEQSEVREGLIRAILEQDSPIVQSALVDIMLALQEKNVTQTLKEFLKKDSVNQEIRNKVNSSLLKLL